MRASDCGGQPVEQVDGVPVMQPDVCEAELVDRDQRLRHAVDERLASDEAGARVSLRLRDQMLRAAEADFEPHVVDRLRKQGCEIVRRGRA